MRAALAQPFHPSRSEVAARILRKTALALGAVLLPFLPAADATADEFPLWELGAGLGVIDFPDYRGSNERKTWLLPVPYFVYRGDILKADQQRVRGLFFHSDRVELDASVNGSVPVKSDDNQARSGMPDLDPTLEIGPALNLSLVRSPDRKISLELRLPVRAVIATDFSRVHGEGWVATPNVNLDLHGIWPGAGWNLGMLAGPLFADSKYHQYFYGVEPAFATPQRPAYSARGGYAGTQFVAALSKRYPGFWVGGFVRWDTLDGAVFADSPLVKTRQYFTAGLAVSWVFADSATRVEADY
jgi:outer membrane scaffolding protein for murein synthesis (MipA/OmpV family)